MGREAQMQWHRLGMVSAVALVMPLLAACGGGGGGGSSAPSAQVDNGSTGNSSSSSSSQASIPAGSIGLTGVVIGNAPIPNATVTVVDRNDKNVKTTADASGRYFVVIDPGVNPPPYALRAVDPAYGEEVQYSVLLQAPSLGTSAVVNITPLTTAVVAGTLTTGNPDTIGDPTVLNAVTAADIAASQAAAAHILQNFLTDAGVSASTDFISSPMTTDHTGLHKVLDEIRVSYVGTGEQVLDLLHSPGTYEAQRMAKSNLSVVNAANAFTADSGNASVIAATNFESLRSALQDCYSQSVATRVANGCSGAISSSFKDGGQSFSTSAATNWSSATLTGAAVASPKVVYIESPTKVLLQLTVRPNAANAVAWMPTYIAQKVNGSWILTGDQQDYPVTVEGYLAEHWGYSSGWTAPDHRYYSGLIFNVPATITNPSNSPVSYVVVTGQGLPSAGLTLTKSAFVANLPYLVVDNKTGTAPAASNTVVSPTAGFQLDFGSVDAPGNYTAITWPTTPDVNQASARVTDFTPYNSFPVYTFKLYFADGTFSSVTQHLIYAPRAASAATGFSWASLSGNWQSLLVSGQTSTSYSFAWTGMPATGTGKLSLRVGNAGSASYYSGPDDTPTLTSVTYGSGTSPIPTNTTSASFNLGYRHPGSLRRYTWWSY